MISCFISFFTFLYLAQPWPIQVRNVIEHYGFSVNDGGDFKGRSLQRAFPASTPSPPLELTVFEEKSFPEVQQAIRLG